MTKWISFQNTMIEYELIYRRRKTMEIRIEPPGRVVLIVPLHTSDAMISTIMKKKEGWLREKLALMKRRVEQQVPHRFVCGEPFLYQGQLLRLELISTPSNQKSWVKREGERLIVAAPTPEPIPVRKAIEGWYRQQTLELVKDRILFYQPLIQRKPSQVQVKEQKRRWGSCSSAGKLMFNWRISSFSSLHNIYYRTLWVKLMRK